MGEAGDGEAYKLLDEITKMQQKAKSLTLQPSMEDVKMEVDEAPAKPQPVIDAQSGFKKCLQAIIDKEWSRLFHVR
jgi:hypothetical protein